MAATVTASGTERKVSMLKRNISLHEIDVINLTGVRVNGIPVGRCQWSWIIWAAYRFRTQFHFLRWSPVRSVAFIGR